MNEIKKRERTSTNAPNDGGMRSMGSSQGAERNDEALVIIRSLKQEEKDINVVIVAASAICASLIWCSGQDDLQAPREKYLYTALFSRVSQKNSLTPPRVAVPPIPHVPDPALAPSSSFGPSFGLLWANAYWITVLASVLPRYLWRFSSSKRFGITGLPLNVAAGRCWRRYIHRSPWMVRRRLGTGPRRRMRCTDFSGSFSFYPSWRTSIASFALLVLQSLSRLPSVVCSTSLVTPNRP
ncbi:hypothetical protein H4582DRAFT_1487909 [Lactarius indigo]|nr:hypothetical protein H4582DRAFT_1487909 [Lactarius indigo]